MRKSTIGVLISVMSVGCGDPGDGRSDDAPEPEQAARASGPFSVEFAVEASPAGLGRASVSIFNALGETCSGASCEAYPLNQALFEATPTGSAKFIGWSGCSFVQLGHFAEASFEEVVGAQSETCTANFASASSSSPGLGTTDDPGGTSGSGNPGTGDTSTSDTGNTGTSGSGNTGSGHTGNSTGNTGTSGSGNTGSSGSGNTGSSGSGDTGTSGNTSTDSSGTDSSGHTGNTGSGDTGNTGTDSSGNTGNTGSGNTGTDSSGRGSTDTDDPTSDGFGSDNWFGDFGGFGSF